MNPGGDLAPLFLRATPSCSSSFFFYSNVTSKNYFFWDKVKYSVNPFSAIITTYPSTLQYLISKCGNVKFSEGCSHFLITHQERFKQIFVLVPELPNNAYRVFLIIQK